MNRLARLSALLSVLFALGLVCAQAARQPEPDAAEAKIRLLSEALHARDIGDIPTARKNLQELLALTPNDETVKRLLASLDRGPQKKVTVSGGTVTPSAPDAAASEADQLAHAEEQRLNSLLATATAAARETRALARQNQFAQAIDTADRALAGVPENNVTKDALADLGAARAEAVTARDQYLAGVAAAAAKAAEPAPAPAARPAEPVVAEAPAAAPAAQAPAPVAQKNEAAALVARGRSQYLAGDADAARKTFERAEALEPGNADANYFLKRIVSESTAADADRKRTTAQMINEVNKAWQRPGVFTEKEAAASAAAAGPSPLLEKLNRIILPSVNFSGMELSRVVNTLSVISEEYDQTGATPKGVNIVLMDQGKGNPSVNITLRNLPLKRVLDFITDSVGYQYEVQADAIVVRPGGEQSALDTQFFPISRSTVLRMSGKGAAGTAAAADPAKAGAAATPAPDTSTVEGEGQAIRNFLQLAGVSFGEGSTLAFDGSQLIVTQTPRNMERIRNILNRYNDVRQVEIEAKFMEVQEGVLDELGVQWNIATKATQHSGAVATYTTGTRSLADAFSSAVAGTAGAISRAAVPSVTQTSISSSSSQNFDPTGTILLGSSSSTSNTSSTTPGTSSLDLPIVNNAPTIPGTNNIGVGANPLASITGILGEFNVNAVVRALSQKTGTELLSAPKLTVLSGNAATITVAQELRYPQSYGQVQSQVGTGSASGGGSAGVTITAGTPQEFTTRNVGVELKVTPTVEEDDYSISLDLNPKVTEFEGFVEYGGQSVAVSGSTTVTVPSGFYQPIFGVREMTTKVTIWDGATLVMGGLTREDVKNVSDKVPVLGNLPGLGRLFRSSGESTQKRNLLIFVTANLVSPGGSLKKQSVQGVQPGTLYQNPTIVTPAGASTRGK